MSIPTYQEFYVPLLRCLADGRARRRRDCNECLADLLELTDAERSQLLESGRQTVLNSRSGWAATYLGKAGLIDRPGRGIVEITERGRAAIAAADAGSIVDNAYLRQFPEFVVFESSSRTASAASDTDAVPDTVTVAVDALSPNESVSATQTPLEVLEAGYQALRATLASDLLERIKAGSPEFFERLVLDLLVSMGYGGSRIDAAEAVGGSGDGGIDGIIKEDKLGLDSIYLQAKRWENPVGRPLVQGFAGSLEGHRARKGVFITTSKFSQDARDYVQRIEKRIVLIDGKRLTNLMIDHGVDVAEVATYPIKRIDEDYFEDS